MEIEMSNKIVPFNQNQDNPMQFIFDGHPVRIVRDADGEPLFVAIDICDALDITNVSQALSRLDEDEKCDIILNDIANRPNKFMAVTESGLYTLVLSSRKAIAKTFKRWVTHDVLPTIRETGSYINPNLDPLDVAKQMIAAIENQRKQIAAIEREQAASREYERETRHRLVNLERRTPQQQYFTITEYCYHANLEQPRDARRLAMERRAIELSDHLGIEILQAENETFFRLDVLRRIQ
jgi:prophage antirepressor-like protein